jgi:hypothetical protein
MFSSKKIFEELLATEPKIKHDEASFAMLNMESSIQNTKFEGAAISVTIDYYRSLLLYSNDLVKSPLSSKALDVALKAVDGLLYFYDRIHTPDFRIFQYKKSLKLFENKGLRNLGTTLFYFGK